MHTIPPGFEPHFRKSPVTDPWEPIYSRVDADTVRIGLWLSPQHCNSRGLVHGGVLAALADNAMGLSIGHLARTRLDADAPPPRPLTVNLGIDYVDSAQAGQWLEITPRIIRLTRTMGFADALLSGDGKTIARAHATFRLGSPAK